MLIFFLFFSVLIILSNESYNCSFPHIHCTSPSTLPTLLTTHSPFPPSTVILLSSGTYAFSLFYSGHGNSTHPISLISSPNSSVHFYPSSPFPPIVFTLNEADYWNIEAGRNSQFVIHSHQQGVSSRTTDYISANGIKNMVVDGIVFMLDRDDSSSPNGNEGITIENLEQVEGIVIQNSVFMINEAFDNAYHEYNIKIFPGSIEGVVATYQNNRNGNLEGGYCVIIRNNRFVARAGSSVYIDGVSSVLIHNNYFENTDLIDDVLAINLMASMYNNINNNVLKIDGKSGGIGFGYLSSIGGAFPTGETIITNNFLDVNSKDNKYPVIVFLDFDMDPYYEISEAEDYHLGEILFINNLVDGSLTQLDGYMRGYLYAKHESFVDVISYKNIITIYNSFSFDYDLVDPTLEETGQFFNDKNLICKINYTEEGEKPFPYYVTHDKYKGKYIMGKTPIKDYNGIDRDLETYYEKGPFKNYQKVCPFYECLHGGICDSEYEDNCPMKWGCNCNGTLYEGERCQYRIDPIEDESCHPACVYGECKKKKCICDEGYKGETCKEYYTKFEVFVDTPSGIAILIIVPILISGVIAGVIIEIVMAVKLYKKEQEEKYGKPQKKQDPDEKKPLIKKKKKKIKKKKIVKKKKEKKDNEEIIELREKGSSASLVLSESDVSDLSDIEKTPVKKKLPIKKSKQLPDKKLFVELNESSDNVIKDALKKSLPPKKMIPKSPKKSLPKKTLPKKTLPKKQLPDDETLPKRSLPKKSLPKKQLPKKQLSDNETLPKKSLPKKSLPKKQLPNNDSNDNLLSPPKKKIPKKTLPTPKKTTTPDLPSIPEEEPKEINMFDEMEKEPIDNNIIVEEKPLRLDDIKIPIIDDLDDDDDDDNDNDIEEEKEINQIENNTVVENDETDNNINNDDDNVHISMFTM